jgi:hypothetical protein
MTTVFPSPLFAADDIDEVLGCLRSFDDGALLDSLRVDLDAALRGSDDATRRYLRGYRQLTSCLLSEAGRTRPDLIVDLEGEPTPADAHGHPAVAMLATLHNASAEGPFTTWSTHFDLGDAVALHLTSRVRAMCGVTVLNAPAEPLRLDDYDDLLAQRFVRRVRAHLNHPDDEPPLRRLMRFYKLSKSELGRLFGVSRQAIDGWLTHGVPADREDKLGALLALTDLLERRLKPDRAAGVARRKADAYGGKTMLDMIADERHRELLDLTRASFDWSQAA